MRRLRLLEAAGGGEKLPSSEAAGTPCGLRQRKFEVILGLMCF